MPECPDDGVPGNCPAAHFRILDAMRHIVPSSIFLPAAGGCLCHGVSSWIHGLLVLPPRPWPATQFFALAWKDTLRPAHCPIPDNVRTSEGPDRLGFAQARRAATERGSGKGPKGGARPPPFLPTAGDLGRRRRAARPARRGRPHQARTHAGQLG